MLQLISGQGWTFLKLEMSLTIRELSRVSLHSKVVGHFVWNAETCSSCTSLDWLFRKLLLLHPLPKHSFLFFFFSLKYINIPVDRILEWLFPLLCLYCRFSTDCLKPKVHDCELCITIWLRNNAFSFRVIAELNYFAIV